MRYPDHNEIADPSPNLPRELAERIAPIIPPAVAQLRRGGVSASEVLIQAANEIFELLTASRSWGSYREIESVRQAVNADIQTALAFAYYIHNLAGGNRLLFIWNTSIWVSISLRGLAEGIETEWWERHAVPLTADQESALLATETQPEHGPKPRHPATPDTETARRIEAFRQRIEAEGGRPVGVKDMCDYSNYSDATMFQRVQREAEDQSKSARKNVERMMGESAEEFWRTVEANRKKRESKEDKRTPPHKPPAFRS